MIVTGIHWGKVTTLTYPCVPGSTGSRSICPVLNEIVSLASRMRKTHLSCCVSNRSGMLVRVGVRMDPTCLGGWDLFRGFVSPQLILTFTLPDPSSLLPTILESFSFPPSQTRRIHPHSDSPKHIGSLITPTLTSTPDLLDTPYEW